MDKHTINIFKLAALNLAVLCGFSGCSLFDFIQRKATQGNLPANQWYIQKIVVFSENSGENGEEFLSPQVLAQNAQQSLKQAQQDLPNTQNTQASSVSNETSNGTNQSNNINGNNTNNTNGTNGGYEPTPLQELAQIDKIATMDFDTKENRISGESGCGAYYARYAWNDKSHLEIVPGSATRKICTPREVTRFEFRFVRGLDGKFEITQKDEKTLTLKGEKMTIYLYR